MLQSVGLIVVVTTSCMAGVAVFAYYAMKGCDPLTNGDIQSSNQVKQTFGYNLFRFFLYQFMVLGSFQLLYDTNKFLFFIWLAKQIWDLFLILYRELLSSLTEIQKTKQTVFGWIFCSIVLFKSEHNTTCTIRDI